MGVFLVSLKDGRVLATNSTTSVFSEAGDYPITITVPDLKQVEYVLQYKFTTDPTVDPGTPVNERIVGNVVGVTLVGVGAGTTLTAEVVVIGI